MTRAAAPASVTLAMVFKVALTGGIASGKSTVAGLFADLHVPVIDTDVLAREVVVPGSAGLAAVAERFGPDIVGPDGRLARRRLRSLIFQDSQAKQDLEAILHPRIRALVARRSAAAGGPYQVIEIPLLVESGQRMDADRVLVVDCDEATQIARLTARDGSDEAQARRILAQQATREQRLAVADDVIVNDTDIANLSAQVLALHTGYLAMARGPR